MLPGWKGYCHRCGKKSPSFIGSYFNLDLLCPECREKEEAHPKFAEARAAEVAACRSGDYNFPGIGKPDDL
jgi:hypothetical protein